MVELSSDAACPLSGSVVFGRHENAGGLRCGVRRSVQGGDGASRSLRLGVRIWGAINTRSGTKPYMDRYWVNGYSFMFSLGILV